MGYWSSIPTSTTNRPPPSAGPSSGAVAFSAALPAFAGAIPGPMGAILQGLAGIPSSMMNYETTKAATERENENLEGAKADVRAYTPYVARPKEYNIDVRVPYVAQAVRTAVAGNESGRRAAEDAMIRYGSGSKGRIADSQLYQMVDDIRRAGQDQTRGNVSALWEAAEKEYIANKLAIGNAELQRGTQNQALSSDKLRMLVDLALKPYGVTSSQGISDRVTSAMNNFQQSRLIEHQIDAQQSAARNNLFGSLIGSGIGAAGNLGGAAMLAA